MVSILRSKCHVWVSPASFDLISDCLQGLFQEKDYLNGRFFHKRAFYLATIASAILQSKTLKVDVKYESLAGDCRLTKLVLTAVNGTQTYPVSLLLLSPLPRWFAD